MNIRSHFSKEYAKFLAEFNAPLEAKDIIDNPSRPSGTLPHSVEAVIDELAHWGQFSHPRVMDPEIDELMMKLKDILETERKKFANKTEQEQTEENDDEERDSREEES